MDADNSRILRVFFWSVRLHVHEPRTDDVALLVRQVPAVDVL